MKLFHGGRRCFPEEKEFTLYGRRPLAFLLRMGGFTEKGGGAFHSGLSESHSFHLAGGRGLRYYGVKEERMIGQTIMKKPSEIDV